MDKNVVKARAAGHWAHVVRSLCSVDPEVLNGRKQPCPKCGGHDRFRVFDDFNATGGFICNQCKNETNGDGLALVQWLNGWTFEETVDKVGELLTSADPPAAVPERRKDTRTLEDKWRRRVLGESARHAIIAQWCGYRRPTDPTAAIQTGAQLGCWPANRHSQDVVVFPGKLSAAGDNVAYLMYREDGDDFPATDYHSKRKTHLVAGSRNSWVAIGGWDRVAAAAVVVRVEGIPDGLALLPILPANWAVVSPTCGAGWSSDPKRQLPLDLFDGRVCVIAGDADTPGQDGLKKMAAAVRKRGESRGVWEAVLPYEVAATSGPDLRDWLAERPRDHAAFESICVDWIRKQDDVAAVFGGDAAAVPDVVFRNWESGERKEVARAMPELVAECQQITGGWPCRVGEQLFIDDGGIRVLSNPSKLVAELGFHAKVDWRQKDGMATKSEFFEALAMRATEYKAIEHSPHHPEMPEHYYACGDYESGDGRNLAWLMARLNPATDVDQYLIVLMLATVFWGGPAGQRPAFVITADGRGAGKTTLAAIAGALSQGFLDVSTKEDPAKIKERLLTPTARDKRIVQIDNIKAHKFSSAEVEAMITAPVISGRELYQGESQRPNTVLWLMTMNGVSMSKDVAQRSIIIRLEKPPYSAEWQEEVFSYIREHRREIVGDLLAFLRASAVKLEQFSRWGVWERQVMARSRPPEWDEEVVAAIFGAELETVRRVVRERQDACDVDAEEAGLLEDHVAERLDELGYDADVDVVWVPTSTMATWYGEVYGAGMRSTSRAGRGVTQAIQEGSVTRLAVHKMKRGRGFLWTGVDATAESVMQTDMAERLEYRRKRHPAGGYVAGGAE